MIIDHLDGQTEVNAAWGAEEWTPIFYAVQRDNKRMFYSLLKHGADIYHRINSPNRNDWKNWTLLHVAARNIIDNDLELCVQLLDDGLCPDGIDDPIYGGPPQTPLSIAIEENQFALANLLREKGANIDSPCGYIDLQRIKLNFECSILGCVVASNLRFSGPRLKYLLWPTSSTIAHAQPDFIVVPRFGFTALHIAVLGEKILYEPEERDPDVASDILRLLLEKFEHAEELNAQTGGDLMTVLHLAVQCQNLDAVKQLLDMEEIDISLKNIEDQSPLEIAKQDLYDMSRDDASSDKQTEVAQHIIDLLTNYGG